MKCREGRVVDKVGISCGNVGKRWLRTALQRLRGLLRTVRLVKASRKDSISNGSIQVIDENMTSCSSNTKTE